MVRFLHTADLQLGMRAKEATSAGTRLRAVRFDTLDAIVMLAKQEAVDGIIIAGDLFEDNQVNATTVARAVQILRKAAPIPVFILPGNHDPLESGSVYHRREFQDDPDGGLVVLRTAAPLAISETCVLFPCPLYTRSSLADPTAWIPSRETADTIRIGIAHGSTQTIRQDFEHPIPVDVIEQKGLDYLALGHWHGTVVREDQRLAYAGTPEQTSFGEERTGEVLLVSIASAGSTPVIERRAVGTLRWLDWQRQINTPVEASIQAIQREIEALEDGAQTLLRLTVSGQIAVDDLPLVTQLQVWVNARCANGDLLYGECQIRVQTTEALAGALRDFSERDPIIAAALADLQALAAGHGHTPDVMGQAPRDAGSLHATWGALSPPSSVNVETVAQQAITQLAEIAMEVRS